MCSVYSVYTYIMRVNIYIRKEDEEKWLSIPNKAEWLHSKLADTPSTPTKQLPDGSTAIVIPFEKNNRLAEPKTVEQCPHGYGKGFCKKEECNRKYK